MLQLYEAISRILRFQNIAKIKTLRARLYERRTELKVLRVARYYTKKHAK